MLNRMGWKIYILYYF